MKESAAFLSASVLGMAALMGVGVGVNVGVGEDNKVFVNVAV